MWLKPKFDQFINCWRSVINVPKFSTTEKQVRWVRTYVVTFGNFMSFCNINSGWKRVVWFFDEKIYLFIHGLVNLSNFRDYILLPKTFFIKFFFVKINFSSKIISDEKRNSVYNFFNNKIFWQKMSPPLNFRNSTHRIRILQLMTESDEVQNFMNFTVCQT